MNPFIEIRDGLDNDLVAARLQFALSHQNRFSNATLKSDGRAAVDPQVRITLVLGDFENKRHWLRSRVEEWTVGSLTRINIAPFEPR